MNKINKKIPMTLDRMLYLICYNWGICSEVEEIITKTGILGRLEALVIGMSEAEFCEYSH